MPLPKNYLRFEPVGHDEPVRHGATPIRQSRAVRLTAAQVLRHHNRRPLRASGTVRQNFAALQSAAARRGPRI